MHHHPSIARQGGVHPRIGRTPRYIRHGIRTFVSGHSDILCGGDGVVRFGRAFVCFGRVVIVAFVGVVVHFRVVVTKIVVLLMMFVIVVIIVATSDISHRHPFALLIFLIIFHAIDRMFLPISLGISIQTSVGNVIIIVIVIVTNIIVVIFIQIQQRRRRTTGNPPQIGNPIPSGAEDQLIVKGIVCRAGDPVGVSSSHCF
mmetsp:Transcript_307/g.762  ORF Transcript_307/g.762 Transcript_307/m.762 type:complete len:201 (-) Transcript_307:473-1075(-)